MPRERRYRRSETRTPDHPEPNHAETPERSLDDSPIAHRTRSRLSRQSRRWTPINRRRIENRQSEDRSSIPVRGHPPLVTTVTPNIGDTQVGPALQSDKTEEHPSCSICLMDYAPGERMTNLACSHRYHTGCIARWLEGHDTCPLCRQDIQVLAPAWLEHFGPVYVNTGAVINEERHILVNINNELRILVIFVETVPQP